jgi:hypothetical protein
MRPFGNSILLLVSVAGLCLAQGWEFGVASGAGFNRKADVATPAGSASLQFRSGAIFSTYFAQNPYRYVGGELRYTYMLDDLALKAGGVETVLPGKAHLVHYDLVVHSNGGSRVQVFGAFGGGVKVFQLDAPSAPNPAQGAYLFRNQSRTIAPAASFGGGVKVKATPRLMVRFDVRDYVSPFPTQALTESPSVKFSNDILHNVVAMAGFSVAF